MRFYINDLQKMLGLSRSTILYYEEKKLLFPKHLENGYRDFSAEDMLTLKQIIALRNMGLGVREIEQVLRGETPGGFEGFLKEQQKALRKELQQKLRLLALTEDYLAGQSDEPELISTSPYFVTASPCCDIEHSFFSESESARALIRFLPFADFCFLFPESFWREEGGSAHEYLIVNHRGISLENLAVLDIDSSELRPVCGGLCLRAWVKNERREEGIERVKAYLKRQNLLPAGEAVLRMPGISVLSEDDMLQEKSELLIPVKKAPAAKKER